MRPPQRAQRSTARSSDAVRDDPHPSNDAMIELQAKMARLEAARRLLTKVVQTLLDLDAEDFYWDEPCRGPRFERVS